MELRAIKSLCPGADEGCGFGQIFRAREDQRIKATVCAGDSDLNDLVIKITGLLMSLLFFSGF